MHIGDRGAAEIQFIAFGCQSSSSSKGIQPNWSGPSGKGKSAGVDACHHLLPKMYVLNGSVTAKSLYHHGDLPDGACICLDDVNVKEGDDLEATIKRSVTAFQEGAYHETLDGNRNLQRMKLPKRLCWSFTYVDVTDSGDQFLNRVFVVKADSTKEADEKVCDFLLKQAEQGKVSHPLTNRVMICKAMMLDIKNRPPYKVVISELSKIVTFADKRNRRNPSLFIDMVVGLTCLRHRQRRRERTNDGWTLYTDLADILEAARIFNEQSDYLLSRLDESERHIMEFLEAAGSGGLTIRGLSDGLMKKYPDEKWSEKKVRRLLLGEKGRSRSGLIEKIGGIQVDEEPRTDDEGKPIPGGKGIRHYCFSGDLGIMGVQAVIVKESTSGTLSPDSPPFPQALGKGKTDNSSNNIESFSPNSPIRVGSEKIEDSGQGGGTTTRLLRISMKQK